MIDNTDKIILKELSKNSNITMKELGQKVHLSGQATSIRVAKLKEKGIIEGYSIKLNHIKLGKHVHVMINIYTKIEYHKSYLEFIHNYSKDSDCIVHNYKISGDGCYLLECRFEDNEKLDKFLIKLNEHVNYKLTVIINDNLDTYL